MPASKTAPLPLHTSYLAAAHDLIRRQLQATQRYSEEIQKIARQKAVLERELLLSAPEKLTNILDNGIVDGILNLGEAYLSITIGDVGIEDFAEARRLFTKLKKNWKWVVNVDLPTKKQFILKGYFEVDFYAYRYPKIIPSDE